MFRQKLIVVLLGIGVIGVATARADDKETATAHLAKFMQAMKAEDIDAVLKTVGVPWFHNGKSVIESKDELKKTIQQVLDKQDLSQLKYDVKQVATFGEVANKLNPEELEVARKVAKDSDIVIQVSVDLGDESDNMAFLIRVEKGAAKVIGVRD